MRGLLNLFEHLPMVVFWVKDRDGRFVRCNRKFEELHDLGRGEWEGMTDFDLHSPELAARYREEDERVIKAGKALDNQVWMVPGRKGLLHWWV